MSETYFRVQDGSRNPADLLDATGHSYAWGHEFDDDPMTRHGISVCRTREALATYLAGSGIPFGQAGWVIVELEGYSSADKPIDAHEGEYLIHPTAIVSVSELDDDFFALIDAAYDALTGE